MDGFEVSLKRGLRLASGDITLYSEEGYFSEKADFLLDLEELELEQTAHVLQTEGFVITEDISRGVLIQGISPESYADVTGMKKDLKPTEISIGVELARTLGVQQGDPIRLALANGNRGFKGLPRLETYTVSSIFELGLYEKDLRGVYILKSELQEALDLEGKINQILINIPKSQMNESGPNSEQIENYASRLRSYLGPAFIIRPFWSDFGYLFEAVKTEKFWIGMILQIVVVISIFNVLAFIIFVNEKRSREIFLLKALGLGQERLKQVWYIFIFLFWFLSCLISIVMVWSFNFMLGYLSLFELPGDVYHLGRLEMMIGWGDYALVFTSALLWLLFLSWLGLRRVRQQSVLYGLRREFS